MSTSTYYLFNHQGQVHHRLELGNGHRSSPIIWRLMSDRYLDGVMWVRVGELWDSADKMAAMTDDDRFLFCITFDRAFLPREEFGRAASMFDDLNGHWPKVAEMLRSHQDDSTVAGFGVYPASVSEDVWMTWNEDAGDEVPNDVLSAGRVEYRAPSLVHGSTDGVAP